jgi:hypothetical protein
MSSRPFRGRGGRFNQSATAAAKKKSNTKGVQTKLFHPIDSATKPLYSFEKVREYMYEKESTKHDSRYDILDLLNDVMAGAYTDIPPPEVIQSNATDPAIKAVEEAAYAKLHDNEGKIWATRKDNVRRNRGYLRNAIIKYYCTEEMDVKLKNESDINTTLMDPLELLSRIEKFMKESQDGRYDVWHGWEQQRKLFNLRQGKDEPLLDYKERFERQAELLKEKMGDTWFDTFATTTQDFRKVGSDSTAQSDFLEGSYSLMCATGFLCNSDRTRTEDLIKDLRENYSRNLDQYPKNMDDATNMLSVHLSTKPLKARPKKV